MLTLKIPETELFDETTETFFVAPEVRLQLEHSLVSISKWEAKWNIPYLETSQVKLKDRTEEQLLDYIGCMTITQNVNPAVYRRLTADNVQTISDYINAPMTATVFNDHGAGTKSPNREVITSEIIYYWMIKLGIPIEFQKWHINRLLALIHVCDLKTQQEIGKNKKMSTSQTVLQNQALNAARRKALNSKG